MIKKLQLQLNRFRVLALSLVLMPATAMAATSTSACNGAKAVGGECDDKGLKTSLDAVFSTLFYVIGAVAVLIIILGGIYYITSTGDAARIKRAKDTVLYAVIGLVLTILARAIVGFVIGQIG